MRTAGLSSRRRGKPVTTGSSRIYSPGDAAACAVEEARRALGMTAEAFEEACHVQHGAYAELMQGRFTDAALQRFLAYLEARVHADALVRVRRA